LVSRNGVVVFLRVGGAGHCPAAPGLLGYQVLQRYDAAIADELRQPGRGDVAQVEREAAVCVVGGLKVPDWYALPYRLAAYRTIIVLLIADVQVISQSTDNVSEVPGSRVASGDEVIVPAADVVQSSVIPVG
jgi:hypothetical protein